MNECRDCVEQPLMADGTPKVCLYAYAYLSVARSVSHDATSTLNVNTVLRLRNRNLAILLISCGRL